MKPLSRRRGCEMKASPFLQRLRLLAYTEGVSTLVLFGVAMPLKYLWDMPLAVRVVGMIHGVLFSALVVQLIRAIKRVPIAPKISFLCMLAAVFPFGPFFADRWLKGAEELEA
jgi:integral membrane protein